MCTICILTVYYPYNVCLYIICIVEIFYTISIIVLRLYAYSIIIILYYFCFLYCKTSHVLSVLTSHSLIVSEPPPATGSIMEGIVHIIFLSLYIISILL